MCSKSTEMPSPYRLETNKMKGNYIQDDPRSFDKLRDLPVPKFVEPVETNPDVTSPSGPSTSTGTSPFRSVPELGGGRRNG